MSNKYELGRWGQLQFAPDKRIPICLIVTFAWGLIAHAYGFLNGNFSYDSLNAFYATAIEETWKIELGRFFVPVYRELVRGQITVPWLIGLLGLLWLGTAVYLVCRLFEIKSNGLMILIAGVMATNITLTAQIATYVYEFDINCFALLLAAIAAFLWRNQSNWLGFLVGSVSLLGAMGIYQSYFSTTMTLMILMSIMDLFRGKDVKKVFLNGVRGICILLVGGLLYFALGKVVYAVADIQAQSRTDVFDFSGIPNPVLFYVNLVKETYVDFKNHFCHNAYRYRIIRTAIAGLIAIVGTTAAWTFIRSMKKEGLRILLICVLILLTPFAMHVTFFLARGKDVHDLMTYSIWLVWVIFPVYVFWFSEESAVDFPLKAFLKPVCCILVAYVLLQNVIISNTAYVKKDIEGKAALSTMTRVVARMEQQEAYAMGETPVAFVGGGSLYSQVPGMEDVQDIAGLNLNNPIASSVSTYYFNTYDAYFKYVLNYPLNICDNELHGILSSSEEVQNMPAFPDESCMKMIDGVLIVKMG